MEDVVSAKPRTKENKIQIMSYRLKRSYERASHKWLEMLSVEKLKILSDFFSRYIFKLIPILVIASVLFVTSTVSGEVLYDVTDLGLGYACSINNSSQVGGYGFIWDKTNGRQETGKGYYYISDNGWVAGSYKPSDTDSRPCVWNAVDGIQDIGSAGHRGYANGINNSGQVAVWYGTDNGLDAFLWDSKNGLKKLFSGSCATDINNKGQVAINAFDSGSYFWDSESGYMTYIGPFRATKLNDIGQVIGYSYSMYGDAYIWDNISGLTSLGTISGYTQFGARGINDNGVVVGVCHEIISGWPSDDCAAFIWDKTDGMKLLQNLIDPKSGWTLNYANDINVYGEIVGMASLNGVDHAILLSPKKASAPSEPKLLLAISGLQLSVSWNNVANSDGYNFSYAPAPYNGSDTITTTDMADKTSFSVELWDGAAFFVAVQAYNDVGVSAYSNIEYFEIDLTNISVTPSNLSLSPGETKTCDISGGTRPYSAASSDPGIATVSVSANLLYVTGISTGSTTLTVYDNKGDSVLVYVTVPNSPFITYTNSLGMTFILLPAGTFTMGSPSDELGRDSDEGPQHQVTLTQPFYMQQTEVTQAQWEAVMGSNPSYLGGPSYPVESVSWKDVHLFIWDMNARGEGTYSLPTEAQWEYAARAGSTTAFYNGGITETGSGFDRNLNAIGWYTRNSASDTPPVGQKTHPVGQKTPNAWGLNDMSGNVSEWCEDWYGSSYYGSSPASDPTGPSSGLYRVARGGSMSSSARYCRSANRGRSSAVHSSSSLGFRLIRQP